MNSLWLRMSNTTVSGTALDLWARAFIHWMEGTILNRVETHTKAGEKYLRILGSCDPCWPCWPYGRSDGFLQHAVEVFRTQVDTRTWLLQKVYLSITNKANQANQASTAVSHICIMPLAVVLSPIMESNSSNNGIAYNTQPIPYVRLSRPHRHRTANHHHDVMCTCIDTIY